MTTRQDPAATVESPHRRSLAGRAALGSARALWSIVLAVSGIWAVLALHYSNLPWPAIRLAMALGFAIFGLWVFWIDRRGRTKLVYAVLWIGVAVWFSSIPPSHDREWRREVAVMPRAIVDGDTVRFTGYRNFEYRDRHDFDERLEEREVSLDALESVDLFISYWTEGPVGHTFVSFNFKDAAPVCISIETRPEIGESYAPIASIFKEFELIYVVGDERDLIRVRSDHRDEEIFLYRLKTPPAAVRQLFLEYCRRIDELADRAEWYHLLKNNCTLNIMRYKNAAGREGSFDIRHLLNGWIDRYFHATGMIDTTLPFAEMREVSRITAASRATDPDATAEEFSRSIRRGLPGHGDPSDPATSPVSD
ncbi:MAG: DUF4105 domain-containing protein [Phycisphaerales bacterium]|jgi:hypothetical protein